jgi:hypothetical protein
LKKALLILLSFCFAFPILAQNDSLSNAKDSVALAKAEKKRNYSEPRKASIMSACLPGLGQAYNRKLLKIPIIYAGLGGFGYMFVVNNEQYNFYRKNLIREADGDPNTINTTRYDQNQLQTQKIIYRKRRDIAAVGIVIIYILNIIDANVDAHLKTFDVSDDLSLRIEPWQSSYYTGNSFGIATGFSIKLNLK